MDIEIGDGWVIVQDGTRIEGWTSDGAHFVCPELPEV